MTRVCSEYYLLHLIIPIMRRLDCTVRRLNAVQRTEINQQTTQVKNKTERNSLKVPGGA